MFCNNFYNLALLCDQIKNLLPKLSSILTALTDFNRELTKFHNNFSYSCATVRPATKAKSLLFKSCLNIYTCRDFHNLYLTLSHYTTH